MNTYLVFAIKNVKNYVSYVSYVSMCFKKNLLND